MSRTRYFWGDLLCCAAFAVLAVPLVGAYGNHTASTVCDCTDTSQKIGKVTCNNSCTGSPMAPPACDSCCPATGAACSLDDSACGVACQAALPGDGGKGGDPAVSPKVLPAS